MGLLLRLLLALAASLALPAWASSLPAPSTSAPETASGVSAASVAEGHTYFVGDLGAWVHNTCFEDVAKHAIGNGRLQGKTVTEATAYLDELAGSTLGHKTADGASVWRRGSEVLIHRDAGNGVGTYFVAESETAAADYIARMTEREGGVTDLLFPR